MSLWIENSTVHYANAGGPGSPVVYKQGQIVGDAIAWSSQQTILQGVATIEVYNAFVTVDSSGCPWVSYMHYDNNSVQNPWTVQVARADLPSGAPWSDPMQVSNASFYPLRPIILPLSNKKVYMIYFSKNGAEGRLWDGTEWQHPELITNRHAANDPGYSAVSLDDEIHLAFLENPTNNIYYCKRLTDGEWQEELLEPQQGPHSFPILTLGSSKKALYLFWVQDTNLQARKMENGNWDKLTIPNLALTSSKSIFMAVSSFYEVSEGKLGLALLEAMTPFPPEIYKLRYFAVPNT